MNRSRLHLAKADITAYFDTFGSRVFGTKDLQTILNEKRSDWRLAKSTTPEQFTEFLIRHARLKSYYLPFPQRAAWCYAWGDAPLLAALLGLKRNLHFSHHTAMRLHGIAERPPDAIYLTEERVSSPSPSGPLRQAAIDEAFRKPARISNNWEEYEGLRVYLLNGAATGRLGVESVKPADPRDADEPVRATNLERTLIDITVKPEYAGGVREVARAYALAKDRLSIDRLVDMLGRLTFVYPYHQAIGYYLQSAGFSSTRLAALRQLPREYDFYLAHYMGATRYDAEWRLHVPIDLTLTLVRT